MSTYIGFDISPLRIGAAAIDARGDKWRLKWAETHTFKSSEWVTPADRAEVLEVFHEKYGDNPEAIGFEAVFIGPNKIGSVRAAMALGQAESICDYEWPDAKQKVLTAAQWRKFCGIRQGGKEPVMQWALDFAGPNLTKMFSIDKSQDSADAIAIAFATAVWDNQEDA
jgi:Holliday junction resolvasome RuvABC endonuclease subunit